MSTFWAGGALGTLENMCLRSFALKGFTVDVYSFNRNMKIPEGCHLRDAREIVSETSLFPNYYQGGTYAAFSNIFRYLLLQAKPTTWIDADVYLLGDKLPEDEYLFGFEGKKYINGAVLRAPSDSAFVEDLVRLSTSLKPEQVRVWGQLGPRLISAIAVRHAISHLAQRAEVFYPVPGNEVWKLLDANHKDEVSSQVAGSPAIHLWNNVFRSAQVDIDSVPIHPRSYMAFLLESVGMTYLESKVPNDEISPVVQLRSASNPSRKILVRSARALKTISRQPNYLLGLMWSFRVSLASGFLSRKRAWMRAPDVAARTKKGGF